MRLINVDGRPCLGREGKAIDVEAASGGRFAADTQALYERWDEFKAWADDLGTADAMDYSDTQLGAPVPSPRQVFAIGLNYRAHAAESGMTLPDTPMVFTKFPSSVTGPYLEVDLPADTVDWEAELVAVIGREARGVGESRAWDHVAGLTVGQALSERALQMKPPVPQQFGLAKSFPGFSPLGPALVTPDELPDPGDLEIGCSIDDEQMQKSRTGDLIFNVPALVAYLSSILPLLPGDLIFTGTPSGVGVGRQPPRFLHEGERLTTYIEGIGTMRHTFSKRTR